MPLLKTIDIMDRKIQPGLIIPVFVRFLLTGLGFALIVWGLLDARFRDTEGTLIGKVCLPLSVGIGLIILGIAFIGQMRRFALWFALALVGQAISLQLINAGKAVRYQHYYPLNQLFSSFYLPLLLVFMAQVILVAASTWRRIPVILSWARKMLKPWQWSGLGLAFVLISSALSRDIKQYVFELFFASFVQIVNIGNIALMIWAIPDNIRFIVEDRINRLLDWGISERVGHFLRINRLPLIAAIWVTLLSALLNIFIYQMHPHIQDEVIYLFQARYLAHGMLSVPAPPVPEAFSFYMIPYHADRWYSIFPPGWPAILALGVLIGMPWLVNPVLAGICVLLIYIFIQEIYDRRVARVTVLLLISSPWFIFMAMNFMSHTSTLTFALIASIAVLRARQSGKMLWGIMAGSAVGLVSLIRPQDGLILAILLGLWAIGIGGQRLKVSVIVAFVLATVAIAGIILPYNKQLMNSPLLSPMANYYEKYYGPKSNAFGFGPGRGLGWPIDPYPGHSPLEAMINAALNSFSLNIELFGWSTGSLILVLIYFISKGKQKSDYLMLTVIAVTLGFYSLYWFNGGPDFGARYWYLMLVPLIILTVRGIFSLEERISSELTSLADRGIPITIAVLLLCIITMVNYLPWRAIDKYYHYLGMRPDIHYLDEKYHFGKSIILIRGESFPDYQSAWVYNPLDPYSSAPIYAWDQNPQVRAQVLAAYSDRPVWIVNGPSITQDGYKVIAGPLPIKELIGAGN